MLFARFASIAFSLEANRLFAAAPLARRRHFFWSLFYRFPAGDVRRTLVHNALFTASPPVARRRRSGKIEDLEISIGLKYRGGRWPDFSLDFRNQGGRLQTPISKVAPCLTVV